MRIFNRIRRKLLDDLKIKNYFFYAVGEIFLIVIGILIAVQINNLNEHRILVRQERIVLENLREYVLANQAEIMESLEGLQENHNNLILRILHTGPTAELPPQHLLDTLMRFKSETLTLAYDGSNRLLSQDQLSLLRNEELRKALSTFSLTFTRYINEQNTIHDLNSNLIDVHQKYISILNEELNNRGNLTNDFAYCLEQFPSDYLGWLRDRDHQNLAVESKWKVERSIEQLKELKLENEVILDLIRKDIGEI